MERDRGTGGDRVASVAPPQLDRAVIAGAGEPRQDLARELVLTPEQVAEARELRDRMHELAGDWRGHHGGWGRRGPRGPRVPGAFEMIASEGDTDLGRERAVLRPGARARKNPGADAPGSSDRKNSRS